MTNLEQNDTPKESELKQEPEESKTPEVSEPTTEETTSADSSSSQTDVASSDTEAEEASKEEVETNTVDAESDSDTVDQAESEVVENEESSVEAEEVESNDDEEEEVDAVAFYEDIATKAESFANNDDWAFVSNEFANLALHLSDGPDSNDEKAKEAIAKFNSLRDDFEARKRAHYEELNKRKEANLAAKKELLQQLNAIISEEKWTETKQVSQIKGKWESIKLLPHGEIDALNEKFEQLLNEFESHKVDRLVKKLEKEEENFTLKLVILEKMDALNAKAESAEVDFEDLNHKFQDLLIQWRKIGRVPAEKNQQTWDHFNNAQDTFNALRFKNDKKYRQSVERALEKKKKLIAEAESLIDDDSIADAARRVNKLHKAWKKTGNLPQKEENELWDRFKAATDAFNEKKAENLDRLREEEQKNYDAKLVLIQRAKDVQDLENYDEGHKKLQQLMDEWKAIGPVPRKKSSKIWKQFKEAMDAFYNHRREHYKSVRKDQKQNYNEKKDIISKLKEIGEADDPAKAVEEAKKLQAQFKNIGHVPLKFKNKVWKEYREVCDAIYDNFRSSGADLGMERRLASEGIEPEARKEIIQYQKQLEQFRKDVSKLESEMIQFEEAKTYFKPTNKGNKLRDELQSKVDDAAEKIAAKKLKISELVRKINDLKEDSSQ
ncbi:MAG: DUF349 domain-containing protein [Balneolaceae bacterium]|nr:DUF349 domain-containing protein [Balneolaceae bacterium]